MFSKQLFTALGLLALATSFVVAAPPLSCPVLSTVTVAASQSAATSSASATATAASGKDNGNKDKHGRDKNGRGGKGKGGDNSSAAATSSVSSTDSVAATASATPSVGGGVKGIGGTGVDSSAVVSSTAASASASSSAAASGTSGDEQSATTLNPAVIATGFFQDGQQVPAAGQVPSLTSKNNFINFCLTVNKPITNGQQIKTGSCNPAPMGVIAATTNMPSSKFQFPKNNDTIPANKEFTIKMAINNLETGNFVNAQSNYYSAPQQVNGQGNIIGHSHVVIESLTSLDQTTPNDPTRFAFFKGINGAAVNGVVTADVTAGLPAGFYRMASINAAANHQPVLVAVAQHGSLDDMVYFTVQ